MTDLITPLTFEQYINSQDEQRVMGLYEQHTPIVIKTLAKVQKFLIDTKIASQIFFNPNDKLTLQDVHYIFHHNGLSVLKGLLVLKKIVTMLFWYILYKTHEYRIYTGVNYDSDCNAYILLVNDTGDTNCILGFDVKYLDYYYRTIERRIANIDPNSEAYFLALSTSIDSMFDENGKLILMN